MILSDTTHKNGILQHIEIKVFGDNGYGKITDDSDRLYQFVDRINRAMDRFTFLAMTADGRWQWDDNNYTTSSIATTNLVSGQREYEFALDHLEIERVLVQDSSGTWQVIKPIDQQDDDAVLYLENNTGRTGFPTKYDKRGTTLWLDFTPNYNKTGGLKVYFKRGADYFETSDTSKAPGFASNFHYFVPLHASTHYGLDRALPEAKNWYELLQIEENSIKTYFSMRNKDERPRLAVNYQNNK